MNLHLKSNCIKLLVFEKKKKHTPAVPQLHSSGEGSVFLALRRTLSSDELHTEMIFKCLFVNYQNIYKCEFTYQYLNLKNFDWLWKRKTHTLSSLSTFHIRKVCLSLAPTNSCFRLTSL